MKKYIRKTNYSSDETLKVCMIKPSGSKYFTQYKKSMMGVPQNIFSLAACTPDWVEIQMVDETIDIKVDKNTDADIVVIMFSTPDSIRAYELADFFKQKGKTVVLGGLHTTFMQDEALEHADALIIGEAEEIWEELLDDWCNLRLKEKYQRTTPTDLSKVNPYPTDIIPTTAYGYSWSVLVSRGCVNKCSYCTVNKFFASHRYRPIEDIVSEIENCGTDFIELKADNLTIDRDYCIRLFKELEPLDIIWFTALEPCFADDKELVELAAKSGLRSLLLGIETPSRAALQNVQKGHLDIDKLRAQMDYLHEFDIQIDSAMLFGFDEHDNDIWEKTLEFALAIDIDITHGVVPIPFPGTSFYKKLDSEGRLVTKDWSKYDGTQLVYTHPKLSAEDVYYGVYWYEEEFMKRKKPRDFKWTKRWG